MFYQPCWLPENSMVQYIQVYLAWRSGGAFYIWTGIGKKIYILQYAMVWKYVYPSPIFMYWKSNAQCNGIRRCGAFGRCLGREGRACMKVITPLQERPQRASLLLLPEIQWRISDWKKALSWPFWHLDFRLCQPPEL